MRVLRNMIWNLNFKKIKKPLDIYCISFVYSHMTKGEKMNDIFKEIQKDMDEFFAEMDKAIGIKPQKKVKKVQKKA